jgi:hypothetical protein
MSVGFPSVLALPAARIVTWLARNAVAQGVAGREGVEDYVFQVLQECGCSPELIAARPAIDGFLAAEPAVADTMRRQNGKAALAKEPGDYATAEEIVREAKKDGWWVDVQKLCKVRNLPDNGQKGKGKRKFLRGPARKWIETKCKRSYSSVPAPERTEPPLSRIVNYLRTSGGPVSPFIIGFNTRLPERLVLRWLKEVPEAFVEDRDGKWSLIAP